MCPDSLETKVSERWEQLTQIGDVSERLIPKVKNNVDLYKFVLKQVGYDDLLIEMETELDRIFSDIELKLGNEFDKSRFGALKNEYEKRRGLRYVGIGAPTKKNPVITQLQPQN